MLKIIHLIVGASALLLSLALASSNSEAALLLSSFAAANLLIAPVLPTWARGGRRQLQELVSALIVIAAAMQAVFMISGTDSTSYSLLSLITLLAAVVLHLALNLRKVSAKSAPLSQDLSDRETGTVKWF